jgi:hypothetical protein
MIKLLTQPVNLFKVTIQLPAEKSEDPDFLDGVHNLLDSFNSRELGGDWYEVDQAGEFLYPDWHLTAEEVTKLQKELEQWKSPSVT